MADKKHKISSSTSLFLSSPTQLSDTIIGLAAEAETTPQMMRALWELVADASKNMQKGVGQT